MIRSSRFSLFVALPTLPLLFAGACSAPDRNYDIGGTNGGTPAGGASSGGNANAGSTSKGGKSAGGATSGDGGAGGEIVSGTGGTVQKGGSSSIGGEAGAGGAAGSIEGGAPPSSGGVLGSGGVGTAGSASGGAHVGGTSAGGSGTAGSGSGGLGVGGGIVVDCGPLANPANGMVVGTGTTPGSRASYTCATGYALNGMATRVCQNTGVWGGSAPTCDPVDCGALMTPANGNVMASSTLYGGTARYTCAPGYGLVGPMSRSCQANGTWSGSDPSCQFCLFPVENDTLLFWPLDEGKGQIVRDLGPNGLKGALGGTTADESSDPVWVSPARFGPGLSFTSSGRSGQYVYVPQGVQFPKNAFTVEAWVRPQAGYAQFFTAGFINLYVAVNAPNGLDWGIGDGTNWTTDLPQANIPVGEWHYIAVTYDGANMAAYVDGVNISSKPIKPVNLAVPNEYYLGGRPSNTFLNGQLGPVRVSATAHTKDQIAKAFESANACPPPKQ